ncbi:DUF6625 family protein [Flavobacterium maritimum]|uniref:DUF6625 family protein n=1 Tax=Flavobacterium maritimum TaxID=3149042 RepID=UPI0032B33A67
MKIAFVVPYFGKWPVWFPAFLKSCKENPAVQWIFFTDCEIPNDKPKNVDFHKSNLKEIQQLASDKMGFEVVLDNPRKLCDLKPTYGDLFGEYLTEYDFWGFCDIDIIWGNIRGFITDNLLNEYDVITSLKGTISGHFTIIRNNESNILLYKHNGIYKDVFEQQSYKWFDENAFALIIGELKLKNTISVYWEDELLDKGIESVAHQEYVLDKWLYKKGKVYELTESSVKEYMYLHFINWKKTMKNCEVKFADSTDSFYISYSAIHYHSHSNFEKGFNIFNNLFDGYFVREKKRIFFKRLKKKFKRLYKLNL